MQAGDLRDRIAIRRRTETKNAGGGLDIGWADLATVWANIRSINGKEAIIGGVLQGISYFEIVVRHRTDLEVADQILWLSSGDRELNILSAEDRDGMRQWTVIQASDQSPQNA
jgi:SPP1 family predicted phage head-tail adaptor